MIEMISPSDKPHKSPRISVAMMVIRRKRLRVEDVRSDVLDKSLPAASQAELSHGQRLTFECEAPNSRWAGRNAKNAREIGHFCPVAHERARLGQGQLNRQR
jgi:hypothetical protein